MDIFGKIYLDAYNKKNKKYTLLSKGEILDERNISVYMDKFKDWAKIEKEILRKIKGKVLDLGAGTGRHSIYLQNKGCEVHSIELSPKALEVMRRVGIKNIYLLDWMKIDKKFKDKKFDFVLMMFNNFGMLGNEKNIKKILKKVEKVTERNGKFVISNVDPTKFDSPDVCKFPAQMKYRGKLGKEFQMILVSPKYLERILKDSNWKIKKIGYCDNEFYAAYVAVLEKNKLTIH